MQIYPSTTSPPAPLPACCARAMDDGKANSPMMMDPCLTSLCAACLDRRRDGAASASANMIDGQKCSRRINHAVIQSVPSHCTVVPRSDPKVDFLLPFVVVVIRARAHQFSPLSL